MSSSTSGSTRGAGAPTRSRSPAHYCTQDETIYLATAFLNDRQEKFGDFAWVVVLAHEWGHHVQRLLQVERLSGNAFELQADCLAGAYAQDAAARELLEPGDVTEAVTGSADAGDPPGLPQDQPGAPRNQRRAHRRVHARLPRRRGGCALPLRAAAEPATTSGSPAEQRPASGGATLPRPALALTTLLPATLALPRGQPFRLDEAGARTLDDLAAGFPDPAEAARLLRDWGWQENAYRDFASDNPPRDAAGWAELSLHRFASVDAAAEALPYFVQGRMAGTALRPIDLGLFGDQSAALAGPAFNGAEVTIYARRGNTLIRATAIAPSGDPTADAIELALIPLRPLIDEPRVVSPELFAILPEADEAPPGLRLAEEHARSASSLAAGFADPAEAERLFQAWGWRESASRVFVRRRRRHGRRHHPVRGGGLPAGRRGCGGSGAALLPRGAARRRWSWRRWPRRAVGDEARAIAGTDGGRVGGHRLPAGGAGAAAADRDRAGRSDGGLAGAAGPIDVLADLAAARGAPMLRIAADST